ncbi:MAG: tRNA (N6-threonylcarbamoyladenosine(37)-N6)-methyltransferase TrmO [Acidobacteriota bacterium]|nr:tRNA (N6-threonylcarbamoyladenosine(37)-N6)-methyltransferase TrmO [Acidobacteriota bacterium]MDQ7086542.1 tRNA (N6-threonylcarbamoyladenosine(37)-N6)-methyltransferase TrmO [Acidobacteriota bacterium]
MATIVYKPIGVIRSPHRQLEAIPVQPEFSRGIEGYAELRPDLIEGLAGLEEFSHAYLLYHLHRVEQTRLECVPFMDDQPHGIFATRAPWRPNPIGMSLVRLRGVEGPRLLLTDLDVLDGTPLLDIKPFYAAPDPGDPVHRGWLDRVLPAERRRRGRRDYRGPVLPEPEQE